MDGDLTIRADIVDRLEPLALRQREKGPLHRLALIPERKRSQLREKEVYLTVFAVILLHLVSCGIGKTHFTRSQLIENKALNQILLNSD